MRKHENVETTVTVCMLIQIQRDMCGTIICENVTSDKYQAIRILAN